MIELHLTSTTAKSQHQKTFLEALIRRSATPGRVFRIRGGNISRPCTLLTTSKDVSLYLTSLDFTGQATLCALLDEAFESDESAGDNELMLSMIFGGDTPSTKHSEAMHVIRTTAPGQGLVYSIMPLHKSSSSLS